MSAQGTKSFGAAPVSRIDALDAQSFLLVTALRLLSRKDFYGLDALWEGMSLNAGASRGEEAKSVFDNLMVLFARHGRRPLMTHDGTCSCVGADEVVFTHFVRLAATGEPEDAMLMGMLLLRADIVPLAVGLAQQLGLLTRGEYLMAAQHDAPTVQHAYH